MVLLFQLAVPYFLSRSQLVSKEEFLGKFQNVVTAHVGHELKIVCCICLVRESYRHWTESIADKVSLCCYTSGKMQKDLATMGWGWLH